MLQTTYRVASNGDVSLDGRTIGRISTGTQNGIKRLLLTIGAQHEEIPVDVSAIWHYPAKLDAFITAAVAGERDIKTLKALARNDQPWKG